MTKLDIPTQHQIKIAKKTLHLSNAGAFILGGMTKGEAREVLSKLAGWSNKRIIDWELTP